MDGETICEAGTSTTRPIAELGLPLRARNALLRHGVTTIQDLISRSHNELLTEIVGLGVGSLIAIEEALALQNLSLAAERRFFARAKPYSRPKDRHIRNHNVWLRSEEMT